MGAQRPQFSGGSVTIVGPGNAAAPMHQRPQPGPSGFTNIRPPPTTVIAAKRPGSSVKGYLIVKCKYISFLWIF